MALTRKLLKGMGLTEEQVDTIIEAHTETVDGLKEQVKTYKIDAEKVPGLEKKIEELEEGEGEDYKAKYEEEHSKFEGYKKDVAAKEAAASTERLFRAELTAMGINGKRADAIVRATDLTALKVKDGAFEDVKAVQESIKTDWGDFIPSTTTTGAKVDNPPANNGGKYTSREEIMKIPDTAERQKAIESNLELFGKKM
jgi:hypothetical protein